MKRKCIIITNPMIAANKSAQVTLGKFIRVMSACYEEIVVLGGNVSLQDAPENVAIHSVEIRRVGSRIRRMLDLFACQVQVAHELRRCTEQDVPVYFWVADKMLLPFQVARWKKADTRYFLYGNVLKEGKASWLRSLSAQLIIYMARRASSVCVESPGVLREWEGYVALDKARIIHLYSDPQPFTPISRRQKIIGMLCRLTEGKHVLESIEAFAQFHGQHSGYTLEIVGSGKQEAECRALIARLDAQAYIHMTGWLEHRQIAEHTAAWQYLLFPSDTEGMPNSVIEMMAQGIPAIASPVGGVRDVVRHGENGWLLDGVTASDIHAALCCAAAQDACYPAMAQAARETVEAPYSLHGARENARKNI